MLSGRFDLHGLDVEPFVARVVDGTLKRRNIVLSHHRRADLVAFAVSELWVASRKYDPDRYRDFRQFADGVVRRKVVDFFRAELGRSRWSFGSQAQHIRQDFREGGGVHERKRPEFVFLDANPDGDRLDGALERGSSDGEAGDIDLRRLLAS